MLEEVHGTTVLATMSSHGAQASTRTTTTRQITTRVPAFADQRTTLSMQMPVRGPTPQLAARTRTLLPRTGITTTSE